MFRWMYVSSTSMSLSQIQEPLLTRPKTICLKKAIEPRRDGDCYFLVAEGAKWLSHAQLRLNPREMP